MVNQTQSGIYYSVILTGVIFLVGWATISVVPPPPKAPRRSRSAENGFGGSVLPRCEVDI